MIRLQRVLVVTGIVIPAIFVLWIVFFDNAGYQAGWRQASASIEVTSFSLEVLWLLTAFVLSFRVWKETTTSFRATIIGNVLLAGGFVLSILFNWP